MHEYIITTGASGTNVTVEVANYDEETLDALNQAAEDYKAAVKAMGEAYDEAYQALVDERNRVNDRLRHLETTHQGNLSRLSRGYREARRAILGDESSDS